MPLAHSMNDDNDSKFSNRSLALHSVIRKIYKAWDFINDDGSHTVMFQSVAHYLFNADDEEVIMAEAGSMELQPIPEDEEERGIYGLWATELRSWHDPTNIRRKREELGV
jgi:hypothetical protein